MERLEVDRASAAHATAVHRNPWTLVFRGLGHDLVTLARRFRSAVIARRFRSFALAIATAMLIIVFEVAKQTAGGARLVRTVAGVHQSDHLVVLLLRTPLSIFAAAPSLPVWGAIVQVLVVISIAQQILGWRRVVIIAVGSQFLINVVTHATVISGHPGWMGVAGQVFDLDTGPSVVVVALACAGALEAPARWLGTLMVIGLAIELVLTPDAAAHEHMLAVFAGVVLWWVTRAGDEHLGLPALEAVAASQRQRHRRAVRRSASATIAVAGIGAILSALAAPRSGRVHPSVLTDLPVGAQHAANGVVAAGGVALLVLSRGLLRGQRRAWTFSVVLVGMLAMGYLVKGGGLQEASLSVGGLVVLLAAHDSFRAGTDRGSGRFALRSAAGMLLVGFAGAFVAIEAFTAYSAKRPRLPPGAAARTILESLFGWHANDVTVRTAGFLHAGVFGASATVALVCLWRALRPVLARDHALGDRRMEQQRARQLVDRYGGGTLDYFILRDDKSLFFSGDTVVGYTVRFGVCVVSPDPIGPVSQRTAAWGDFRAFTDRQGWTMSVLAASDDWLATYRGFGMTTIYAGDEAVVDTQTFDLGGGDRKSLRQAVNRIARHGYCVTFHDPTTVSPQLRESIESLMHSSRRGGVERGFSMTLGRIFDPRDKGLLLAVCTGPDGVPAAFCQYVPSPAINGWSLDLMRRDLAPHPNGLLDYVVVETIRHINATGGSAVGLNFATMRAVLAEESGGRPWHSLERWALNHLSDSMQISSLWHFNAKYGPRWVPRYIAIDGAENSLHVATAIASAESMWELPVIGRWVTSRA